MQLLKAPICIIGAGPAGLSTSLFLAGMGIPSIVVDKGSFPRHKACGDNISGNTIRTLHHFFPDFVETFRASECISDLRGALVYAPNQYKFEIDYLPLEKGTDLPSCYAIKRFDLDNYLVDKVEEEVLIDFRQNTLVDEVFQTKDSIRIRDKKQQLEVEAKLIIVATGSNCKLPEKLGAYTHNPRHCAVGVRAYFDGVHCESGLHRSELYITRDLMPGGLYITPLQGELVNVNVCMREDVVRKKQIQLAAVMQKQLKEHPLLRKKFAQARLRGKIEGSRLRLGTGKRKLSGDRYLLVGDSAGLIDLLSANGIPQGLASAKIAAEMASHSLKTGDFSAHALRSYDQKVHKRVEHYLKLGKMMAPFMGYTLFNGISLAMMNFIARKFNKNEHLRDLMYDNEVGKTLRRPSFYYNVFFGVKNKEFT